MSMNTDSVLPPGEDPRDSNNKNIDSVGFALERVITMLMWIEEHRASFEHDRVSDPENAERELGFLADASRQARKHMARLSGLMLAGYTFDPSKQEPWGLRNVATTLQYRSSCELQSE